MTSKQICWLCSPIWLPVFICLLPLMFIVLLFTDEIDLQDEDGIG